MQWIQLWAVLADAASLTERRSEFDRLRETQNQPLTMTQSVGGGYAAQGVVNLTIAATMAQSQVGRDLPNTQLQQRATTSTKVNGITMLDKLRVKLQEPCFFNTLVFGVTFSVLGLLGSETITLATKPNDTYSWLAFGFLLLFSASVFLGNVATYFAVRTQLLRMAKLGGRETESVRGSMARNNTFDKMRRNVSTSRNLTPCVDEHLFCPDASTPGHEDSVLHLRQDPAAPVEPEKRSLQLVAHPALPHRDHPEYGRLLLQFREGGVFYLRLGGGRVGRR